MAGLNDLGGSLSGSGGGGESNTTSNSGAGEGLALTKAGVDLPFKSLTASNGIALVASATQIDIDGTLLATASDLTTHTTDVANPHSTDVGNLGSGTLAELNAVITDATLDTSSDTRVPTSHAATHILGGGDEVDGDQIDIDFTPANYTPDTTPGEVTNVDHLSAHLSGIDVVLAGVGNGAFNFLSPPAVSGDWVAVHDFRTGGDGQGTAWDHGTNLTATTTDIMGTQIQVGQTAGIAYTGRSVDISTEVGASSTDLEFVFVSGASKVSSSNIDWAYGFIMEDATTSTGNMAGTKSNSGTITDGALAVGEWTSYTSFVSAYTDTFDSQRGWLVTIVRWRRSDNTLVFFNSLDGVNWAQSGNSSIRTDVLTWAPAEMGFAMSNRTSAAIASTYARCIWMGVREVTWDEFTPPAPVGA